MDFATIAPPAAAHMKPELIAELQQRIGAQLANGDVLGMQAVIARHEQVVRDVGHLAREQSVDRLDDMEKRDVGGCHGEGETAGRALAGTQESLAGQLLKDLGQEVGRNVRLFGNVFHHGVLAFRHLRQIDECPDRIFCRA